RRARRNACGCSQSSYPKDLPPTLHFSRVCPHRATDARQVAGDACRNPVGSRAAIASSGVVQSAIVAPYRNRREGHTTEATDFTIADGLLGQAGDAAFAEDSEENRPTDIDSLKPSKSRI